MSNTEQNNKAELCPLLDDYETISEEWTPSSKSTSNETKTSTVANLNAPAAQWATIVIDKRDINKNVLDVRKKSVSGCGSGGGSGGGVSGGTGNSIGNAVNQTWQEASLKYGHWSCRKLLMRRKVFALLALAVVVYFISSTMDRDNEVDAMIPVLHYSHVLGMKGYLVWSDFCKIPNIDPYTADVMIFFKREKYKPCSSMKLLTNVKYNATADRYVLSVDTTAASAFTKSGIVTCCYQVIDRNSTGVNADANVSLSECIQFNKSTQLVATIDNVLVKCTGSRNELYRNGYALMPERPELRQRLDSWKQKDVAANKRAPSVLMIGIDSISRINLIRAMPKTAQYLYDNEWFEMSGFNKIADNTFPNLMAVLTGYNRSTALRKCKPTQYRGLHNCPFIWDTFRDHGYVTAYGEDEAAINTFNYLKKGFEQPPVDYYMRPFLLGAEKVLPVKRKSSLTYCLGHKHSAEYIYDYAVELATRFRNDSFFGLFWTNTFSHNAISDCSAMDERMVDYLKKFAQLGTLDNTIVIFFSDHGLRFGPTRKTYSGHLEERLPFVFLWLPPYLKHAHPEFVNALSVNKNRLTNPYDLHMTLKHVLELTGRVTDQTLLDSAADCPRCHTLLKPVSHNRSCEDIAIEDHWCTCIMYNNVYKKSKTVYKLANKVVDYINDFVANFHNKSFASMCAPLQLDAVDSAYRAQHIGSSTQTFNNSMETYRIIFNTKPNKALYEATVVHNSTNGAFQVSGEVSRLNSYSGDADCMEDSAAKKYCSCRKKKSKIK